jgi:hypothetical protein
LLMGDDPGMSGGVRQLATHRAEAGFYTARPLAAAKRRSHVVGRAAFCVLRACMRAGQQGRQAGNPE